MIEYVVSLKKRRQGPTRRKIRGTTKMATQLRIVTNDIESRPREIQLPIHTAWRFVELLGGSVPVRLRGFRGGNFSVNTDGTAHHTSTINPANVIRVVTQPPGPTVHARTPRR